MRQPTPLYVHELCQALQAVWVFKEPQLVQDLPSQLVALSVYPHYFWGELLSRMAAQYDLLFILFEPIAA